MQASRTDHWLKTAAHFHAVLWFSREHREAQGADAVAFADANWAGFLPQATVRLGRILDREGRTPLELGELLDVMGEYATGVA